jgi:hypothetical protein
MADLSLASQTMFSDLLQRCLDAEFDSLYSERGRFVRVRSRGRLYWHFRSTVDGEKRQIYVGPVTDASITDRVTRFADIKSDFKGRQEMVRALVAAGLPSPDDLSGRVVEAIWKSGFFRLRGVLVGTVAFQAYAGPLGIKLSGRPLQTQDADFAQFWGISQNIGDSASSILEALRGVDPTFKPVPHVSDPFVTTAYRNKTFYRVDFLTPNRGSDDLQGRPARMKALGGTSAQPLRHLDFLIHETERSVLLTKGGVPVTIPRAERYAVHKLIVAVERQDQSKAAKDILQSATLISALAIRRPLELARAWDGGPRWKEKLEAGRDRLPEAVRTVLADVLARAKVGRMRNKS